MIRVALEGASGYVGGELLSLLLHHPEVEIVAATAGQAGGEMLATIRPRFGASAMQLQTSLEPNQMEKLDLLFLALPHGESSKRIGAIPRALPVIDLAADFRIADRTRAEATYGPHPAWDFQSEFVYGLPELNRTCLREARRIAVPGCFATAASIALLPALEADAMQGPPWISAVTGSSGSGHRPGAKTHHPERALNFFGYQPNGHRHQPEDRVGLAGSKLLEVPSPSSSSFRAPGARHLCQYLFSGGSVHRSPGALPPAFRGRAIRGSWRRAPSAGGCRWNAASRCICFHPFGERHRFRCHRQLAQGRGLASTPMHESSVRSRRRCRSSMADGSASMTMDTVALEARYQLPAYNRLPLSLQRGEGVYVFDEDGRRFLDLYGGHAVASTGHSHPSVVEAIAQQAKQLLFYSNVVTSPVRAQAAGRLIETAGPPFHRVFFVNSGAESNEAALRIARQPHQPEKSRGDRRSLSWANAGSRLGHDTQDERSATTGRLLHPGQRDRPRGNRDRRSDRGGHRRARAEHGGCTRVVA